VPYSILLFVDLVLVGSFFVVDLVVWLVSFLGSLILFFVLGCFVAGAAARRLSDRAGDDRLAA
jgi:hypothetical protein